MVFLDRLGVLLDQNLNHLDQLFSYACNMERETAVTIPSHDHNWVLLDQPMNHYCNGSCDEHSAQRLFSLSVPRYSERLFESASQVQREETSIHILFLDGIRGLFDQPLYTGSTCMPSAQGEVAKTDPFRGLSRVECACQAQWEIALTVLLVS
jgi:hypothetical protein